MKTNMKKITALAATGMIIAATTTSAFANDKKNKEASTISGFYANDLGVEINDTQMKELDSIYKEQDKLYKQIEELYKKNEVKFKAIDKKYESLFNSTKKMDQKKFEQFDKEYERILNQTGIEKLQKKAEEFDKKIAKILGVEFQEFYLDDDFQGEDFDYGFNDLNETQIKELEKLEKKGEAVHKKIDELYKKNKAKIDSFYSKLGLQSLYNEAEKLENQIQNITGEENLIYNEPLVSTSNLYSTSYIGDFDEFEHENIKKLSDKDIKKIEEIEKKLESIYKKIETLEEKHASKIKTFEKELGFITLEKEAEEIEKKINKILGIKELSKEDEKKLSALEKQEAKIHEKYKSKFQAIDKKYESLEKKYNQEEKKFLSKKGTYKELDEEYEKLNQKFDKEYEALEKEQEELEKSSGLSKIWDKISSIFG